MLDKKCKIAMFLKHQVKLKVLFNSIQFIDIIMLAYSQNEVN